MRRVIATYETERMKVSHTRYAADDAFTPLILLPAFTLMRYAIDIFFFLR